MNRAQRAKVIERRLSELKDIVEEYGDMDGSGKGRGRRGGMRRNRNMESCSKGHSKRRDRKDERRVRRAESMDREARKERRSRMERTDDRRSFRRGESRRVRGGRLHEKVTGRDVMSLSSGTIATLTGMRDYKDIDEVQHAFVSWVNANPGEYATWQEAWEEFKNSPKYKKAMKEDVRRPRRRRMSERSRRSRRVDEAKITMADEMAGEYASIRGKKWKGSDLPGVLKKAATKVEKKDDRTRYLMKDGSAVILRSDGWWDVAHEGTWCMKSEGPKCKMSEGRNQLRERTRRPARRRRSLESRKQRAAKKMHESVDAFAQKIRKSLEEANMWIPVGGEKE